MSFLPVIVVFLIFMLLQIRQGFLQRILVKISLTLLDFWFHLRFWITVNLSWWDSFNYKIRLVIDAKHTRTERIGSQRYDGNGAQYEPPSTAFAWFKMSTGRHGLTLTKPGLKSSWKTHEKTHILCNTSTNVGPQMINLHQQETFFKHYLVDKNIDVTGTKLVQTTLQPKQTWN